MSRLGGDLDGKGRPVRPRVPDRDPDHAALPFRPAEAVADSPVDGDGVPAWWPRSLEDTIMGREILAWLADVIDPTA